MTKQELYKALQKHDWWYMMSDDFGVWNSGEANKKKLIIMASESPELTKLYNEYESAVYNQTALPVIDD